jgi:hypothetical protein
VRLSSLLRAGGRPIATPSRTPVGEAEVSAVATSPIQTGRCQYPRVVASPPETRLFDPGLRTIQEIPRQREIVNVQRGDQVHPPMSGAVPLEFLAGIIHIE